MNAVARQAPSAYSAPSVHRSNRYIAFAPISDRRIRCKCGTLFTPDMRPRPGHAAEVRHRPCETLLLVIHVRGAAERIVAEVSHFDLTEIESWGEVPGDRQIVYLLREDVRTA